MNRQNENRIPTLDEQKTLCERVAIARCIIRTNGRSFPVNNAVAKELRAMDNEALAGEKSKPCPSKADAYALFTDLGLKVPADVERESIGAK